MSRTASLLVVSAALLFTAATAHAEGKPWDSPAPGSNGAAAPGAPAAAASPHQKWTVACEADLGKFCQSEVKDGGDARPCLAKHESELSQTCSDSFIRQYRILENCKDDIEKVCSAEANDGRALGKCFNDKQDQLSEKCKASLRRGTREYKKEAAAQKPDDKAAGATATAATPAKPAAKGKKAKKPAAN